MKYFLSIGFLTAMIGIVFNACEDPEITNPADPNYELLAPTLLSVEALTDTSIAITWKNNEEYTKEFVINRKVDSAAYSKIGTVVKGTLAYTDTTCELGIEYSYAIQSKFESKLSDNSNKLQAATIFSKPTNLHALVLSDEALKITWTNNTSFQTGLIIERDDGSGFFQIASVLANDSEYIDSGLTYGESYSYRLAAFTSANASSWATITAATEFLAPSGLIASSLSDNEIQLSWIDNTEFESGFKVERDEGSGFVEIGTVLADITEYTDSGLTFGQSYEYRIAAFTRLNTSHFSPEATTSAIAPLIDFDGNAYRTVLIGDHVWMAGTAIPNVTGNADWSSLSAGASGAYCYNENNTSNADTYGALYNWHAVVDNRKIAPAGWHVPTDDEWKELETSLGMSQVEADALHLRGTSEGSMLSDSAALWAGNDELESNPYFGASGFAALPGGFRTFIDGTFESVGLSCWFWTATPYDEQKAYFRDLWTNSSGVYRSIDSKRLGLAVRCLRD